jgi:hypothetical protein
MELLSTLCSSPTEKGGVAGPKHIVAESDAVRTDALGKAASVYHAAFKQGKPAFPNFAAGQDKIAG